MPNDLLPCFESLDCVEGGDEFARGVADFRDVEHPPEDLLIYSESPERVAVKCPQCRGSGFIARGQASPTRRNCASCPVGCEHCNAAGFLGIDGAVPTSCKAGTQGKIAVLAARYSQGQPLWLSGDRDLGDVLPQCGPILPLVNERGFDESFAGDGGDSFEDDEELAASAA